MCVDMEQSLNIRQETVAVAVLKHGKCSRESDKAVWTVQVKDLMKTENGFDQDVFLVSLQSQSILTN